MLTAVLHVRVVVADAAADLAADDRDVRGALPPKAVVDDVAQGDVVGRAGEVDLVDGHVADLEVGAVALELAGDRHRGPAGGAEDDVAGRGLRGVGVDRLAGVGAARDLDRLARGGNPIGAVEALAGCAWVQESLSEPDGEGTRSPTRRRRRRAGGRRGVQLRPRRSGSRRRRRRRPRACSSCRSLGR